MTFKPVKPKLAASVILLRNESPNTELFMIKRHKDLKFLGGFHAFPGGKTEQDDELFVDKTDFERNFPKIAKNFFQVENQSFGFKQIQTIYITAIRELFEEVGILLATENDTNKTINLNSEEKFNHFLELRKLLLEKKIKFSQILIDNELSPIFHDLIPFKHFITPEFSPFRYDTYFFTLKMPENQEISPISKEIEESIWITPKDAMRRYNKNKILLIPPQLICITDLKKLNRRKK